MDVTPYFSNVVVKRRPYVTVSACEQVIRNSVKAEVQTDGRVRYWGRHEGRWLRVVVEDGALHNAFYDRGFTHED